MLGQRDEPPSATRTIVARLRSLLSVRRLTGASATLVMTTVAMNVLRIGNTVVLTRLLAPADYGLIGIVLSVFFVIAMLTDTGCYAFVVRHDRGLEPDFLDAVWTVHVLRGIMNAALVAAIAWPLAAILGKAGLAPLLAVAAISLAIDGAASLSVITAARRGMVRKLSLVDFSAAVVQMIAGLIAAWFLRDAWAIIIALIMQSTAKTVASYTVFSDAGQRPRFDRAITGELWRFTRMIVASSTLTLIMSQLDRLVLARLFTLPQFGVYSIAGSLATAPTAVAQMYIGRIMYPAFANTWRTAPERVRDTFYAARGTVFYGYLFAAGGLIGSATFVVRLLYDPRYEAAAGYLSLLAITTAMLMLTRPMNEFLVAIGHVRATLEANVIRIVWLVLAAITGYAMFGAWGIVLALSLIEVPAYLYCAFRMKQLGYFSARRDLLAFGTIGSGVSVGVLGSAVLLALTGIR